MVFNLIVEMTILGGAWFGARRGLASQVAGLLSLVAGFLVAIPLSTPLASLFSSKEPVGRLIALAVICALLSLTLYALAFRYHKMTAKWKLEHWDRHRGALMGAVKGCFPAITLTFLALLLVGDLRVPILRPPPGRLMGRLVRALHPLLPREVHDVLHPDHHDLDEPGPSSSIDDRGTAREETWQ